MSKTTIENFFGLLPIDSYSSGYSAQNLKFVSLFLVSSFLFLAGCFSSPPPSPLVGGKVPTTRYTHLDGSYHSFEELHGTPFAVLFWAEWCSHSRGLLEQIAKKENSESSLPLVAVSIDGVKDLGRVKEWISAHANTKSIIPAFSGNALDDEAYLSFGGNDLPHLFFVTADGRVSGEGRSLSDLTEFKLNSR